MQNMTQGMLGLYMTRDMGLDYQAYRAGHERHEDYNLFNGLLWSFLKALVFLASIALVHVCNSSARYSI
jgi:hypothetical protein